MYFECGLPEIAPGYVHPDKAAYLTGVLQTVRVRMEKLEEALTISGLDGETFSEYAKVLFDSRFSRFESMTSDALAEYVLTVHDGAYQAPARMDWPNAKVLADCAFLTNPEWEAIRHLGIGGSDSAAALGVSPYNSRFELYHDKRWTPKPGAKSENRAVFDRGHVMEPRVIQAFCDMIGAQVIPETRMFQSARGPWALADTDAIIRMPNGDICVFEAKTTVAENAPAWADGKVPGHYVTQCRHYLAVLNDNRVKGVYIGCLFTVDYTLHGMFVGSDTDVGRFVTRFIPRDPVEEGTLLKLEGEFFRGYIEAGVEPPFENDPKRDADSLNEIIGPADKSAPIADLEEFNLDLIREILELKAQKKELDDRSEDLKKAINAKALPLIEQLGQAVKGRLRLSDNVEDSYFEVCYAPRRQVTVDQELLEAKYPEAFADCVHVDPCAFRVFSVKEKTPKRK